MAGRSSTLKLLDTAGRPNAFKGLSGWLHRNRLFWLEKLHGIFMDIFLETCDHTHGMKWDTVHITWRLWIEQIILLKSNHYKKCFCQPECCQYKILTVETKRKWRGELRFFFSKAKAQMKEWWVILKIPWNAKWSINSDVIAKELCPRYFMITCR
jgi:hypothetical protein